ncbi:hypothetical protein Pyn_12485 [Prunus yedoensis var. nudiflora]|uniref:Uncharacterized protein n=1 Tax=Prunus yedoensis var. nudiflora TaxID=2094558 RepID=A0A314YIM7_PRUYE|nr:hypothetical protein Pyn_12485 [Prunus yedoensis var. nudiflora]
MMDIFGAIPVEVGSPIGCIWNQGNKQSRDCRPSDWALALERQNVKIRALKWELERQSHYVCGSYSF